MSIIHILNHSIYIGIDGKKELEVFDTSKYSSIVCLVDENTEYKCLPLFKTFFTKDFSVITIKSGEKNKNFEACTEVWSQLIKIGTDRNSLLINLGGGVISDMGGFIACNYKRGIDFINVPTTLLAMIDASIGGKTGVNLDSLKNQIGSFKFPKSVFVFTDFLKTLTDVELKQGYAELLKHALISDQVLWQELRSTISGVQVDDALITKAIKIKTQIVEADPKEQGVRKLLNFGHTIGHSIESWSNLKLQSPLSHGESVAIGLIAESFIAYKKSFLSFDQLKEICDTVYLYFNPVYLPDHELDFIIELMLHDKKNKNGIINFTLLKTIGTGLIDQFADENLIKESLQFYKSFPDRNYIAHNDTPA